MIPSGTTPSPESSLELLKDVRWLTSEAAKPWLAQAAKNLTNVMKLTQLLRAELSPSRTHLVLEQADLRWRARKKFTHADEMFFARQGLEQATDEFVAGYKASRFPRDMSVTDLCCGIGGDWLALAARGPTVGVDQDPIIAHLAASNATALGISLSDATKFQVGDVAQFSVADFAAWHIDPDRRPQGKRTTRVELYSPGPEVLSRFLHDSPNGAIKLAPAAELPDEWKHAAESEWISRDGECKQLVAWFGGLARSPGQHAATLIASNDPTKFPRTVVGRAHHDWTTAEKIGRYVYEVDAAVLAAKLPGVLAEEHGLLSIDSHAGYLSGDKLLSDAALTPFEVLEVMPLDRKRLKAALRERNVGRLEIKKRGLLDDLEKLRAELRTTGDEPATLMLTKFNGSATAIIARRIAPSGNSPLSESTA